MAARGAKDGSGVNGASFPKRLRDESMHDDMAGEVSILNTIIYTITSIRSLLEWIGFDRTELPGKWTDAVEKSTQFGRGAEAVRLTLNNSYDMNERDKEWSDGDLEN